MTELADTLAREHGVPFRSGHAIAARVVHSAADRSTSSAAARVAAAAREIVGREIHLSDDEIARVLSPEHFVAVRRTAGGPSPEVVRDAIGTSRARLDEDRRRVDAARVRLAAAETARRAAVERL